MKKFITIILCMAMIVTMAAGCGAGDNTAGKESTVASTDSAKQGAEPSKTEVKKDPVTLKLFFFSPELQEQYTDMANQYKTETGNTLDITVQQTDYVTMLNAKLNSGDIPDVFMSSAYADNITYKDYCYDLTDEDFMQQLEPSTLNGVIYNGRITGYPFLVQSFAYIYNKKIFADSGITELPKTISQYEEVCKKLEAKGIQPFATGFKEWWVLPQTAWQTLAPIKDAYEGDYQKFVDALNAGKVKFKDIKEMDNVFNMLDVIKKYGGKKPLESDFNDQCASLATGKVAMIHQGNWAEDTIKKTNPDIDLGYLLGPTGEDASQANLAFFSSQTIRIAKDGKHREQALDWLRWVTTSEYGKNWIPSKIKQMSPIKGAAAPDAQLAKETTDLLSKNTPNFPLYYMMFPTGAEQGLGTVLQGYCAGTYKRAQALDELDAYYAKLVKSIN